MSGIRPGVAEAEEGEHTLKRSSTPNIWLSRAKMALFQHFELALVVLVLASLLFITAVVVHKFAFLLFYFIPVLLAGFYLSARHAIGIAVLTAGFVVYITLVDPFAIRTVEARFDFWNLFVWACFLVLTGAIVGRLQERNQRHLRQLRDAYLGIVQILTKYLEAADVDTKSHSERVAAVCSVLARAIGLDTESVQNVWSAALLHDIGKIEVIELIRRAAELNPEEKAKVDQHTELGAQVILTTGTILQDVVPLVLDHHRPYYDGREAIPLGARIIKVADTYDAIVSDRPYRAGKFHWQALEILEEGQGTQFDPRIVEVLKSNQALVQAVYQEDVDLRGLTASKRSQATERATAVPE